MEALPSGMGIPLAQIARHILRQGLHRMNKKQVEEVKTLEIPTTEYFFYCTLASTVL